MVRGGRTEWLAMALSADRKVSDLDRNVDTSAVSVGTILFISQS